MPSTPAAAVRTTKVKRRRPVKAKKRFVASVLAAIQKAKLLGMRAGDGDHRFIGIWAVVVQGRVFVRSWSVKPNGWYRTLEEQPRGVVQVGDQEIPVRAIRIRGERLQETIDQAYLQTYHTPGSIKYARDLGRAKSRATTTELVPLK